MRHEMFATEWPCRHCTWDFLELVRVAQKQVRAVCRITEQLECIEHGLKLRWERHFSMGRPTELPHSVHEPS